MGGKNGKEKSSGLKTKKTGVNEPKPPEDFHVSLSINAKGVPSPRTMAELTKVSENSA